MKTAKIYTMDWHLWWKELKRLAREKYGELSELETDAWRDYYNVGLTPAAAIAEDLTYA